MEKANAKLQETLDASNVRAAADLAHIKMLEMSLRVWLKAISAYTKSRAIGQE